MVEEAKPSYKNGIAEANDPANDPEFVFAQLLSLGFEEVLIEKALKLTNNQERAIQIILKLQKDQEKGSFTIPKEESSKVQENDIDPVQKTEATVTEETTRFETFKMVCLVRTDLGMGVGKIAAQVGHSVVGAYKNLVKANNNQWNEDLAKWESTGHAKIVLKVKSKEDLQDLHKKAREMGLNAYAVKDAGRTQIEAGSLTVCCVGPASSILLDKITGHLKLM